MCLLLFIPVSGEPGLEVREFSGDTYGPGLFSPYRDIPSTRGKAADLKKKEEE